MLLITEKLKPNNNNNNTFRQYLNVLGDSQAKDENKLKAAQELNDSFDVIIAHPQYQTFLDHAMRVFLKLLQVNFYLTRYTFTWSIFTYPIFTIYTFSIYTSEVQKMITVSNIFELNRFSK